MSGQHDMSEYNNLHTNGHHSNGNGNGQSKHHSNNKMHEVAKLGAEWAGNLRWRGVSRPYSAEDVVRLRGSVQIEYTLARMGAERLYNLLHSEDYVPALGALTGNQAVQQVKAGLKAIYLSGWQVAADANLPVICTPIRVSTHPIAFPR